MGLMENLGLKKKKQQVFQYEDQDNSIYGMYTPSHSTSSKTPDLASTIQNNPTTSTLPDSDSKIASHAAESAASTSTSTSTPAASTPAPAPAPAPSTPAPAPAPAKKEETYGSSVPKPAQQEYGSGSSYGGNNAQQSQPQNNYGSNVNQGYQQQGMQQGMQPGMQSGYAMPGMQPGMQSGYAMPGMQPGMQSGYAMPGMQPGMQSGYAMPGMQSGYAMPGMQSGYAMPGMQSGYSAVPGMQSGYSAVPGMQSGYSVVPGMQSGYAMPGMQSGYAAMPGMQSGYSAMGMGGYGNQPMDQNAQITSVIMNAIMQNLPMTKDPSGNFLFGCDTRLERYMLNYNMLNWFIGLNDNDQALFKERVSEVCYLELVSIIGNTTLTVQMQTKKIKKNYSYFIPMNYADEQPGDVSGADMEVHYSEEAIRIDSVIDPETGEAAEADTKQKLYQYLNNPNGGKYFPLFTSVESCKQLFPTMRVAKLSFDECVQNAYGLDGLVYDPTNYAISLPYALCTDMGGITGVFSSQNRFQAMMKLYQVANGKVKETAYKHMCEDMFMKTDWFTVLVPNSVAAGKNEIYIEQQNVGNTPLPGIILFTDKDAATEWFAIHEDFLLDGLPCTGMVGQGALGSILSVLYKQNNYARITIDPGALYGISDYINNFIDVAGIIPDQVPFNKDTDLSQFVMRT